MFSKSFIATAILIASVSAAPLPHARRDVTVKSGDTCTALAAAAGISVQALMGANPSVNAGCTNLSVGQVLSTGGGAAAPAPAAPAAPAAAPATGGSPPVTAAAIVAVAPNSVSCAGAVASCRTAEQSAPLINSGFAQFGINTKGEKAALLSLMAFETGGFVFDINLFPGRPGQGTRNLMMFPFILKYALETPSVAGQVGVIAPGLTADSPADVVNAVAPDTMNAIRALVLEDNLSFASAAWFLKTKCGPEFATNLASGTQASYEAYLTGCIGTTVTPERIAGFTSAIAALN